DWSSDVCSSDLVDSVVGQIESLRRPLENGLTQKELQSLLPAGAARNAIDCALWDLEAKMEGASIFELLELPPPKPLITAYTISLDTPEKMAEQARQASHRPLLKIKLGGAGGDEERIQAVRLAAPQSTLIADANEAWTEQN